MRTIALVILPVVVFLLDRSPHELEVTTSEVTTKVVPTSFALFVSYVVVPIRGLR